MHIQFLGTGDAFCSGGRHQTCFYVTVAGYRFLIDCGATSLKAMRERGLSTRDVDGIFLSHFHGDHFGGLPYVLLEAHFVEARTRPLTILGPSGVAQRVRTITEIAYPGVDMDAFSYSIDFREYAGAEISVGPLLVTAIPVIHAEEALPHGLRIQQQDKVLSFSGDSGWTNALYEIAQSSDLFICECNYYDTDMPTHLCYQRIMDELPNFTCKNIILNHPGPEMLVHLDSCELNMASDGLALEV